jgi:hypothetical protein
MLPGTTCGAPPNGKGLEALAARRASPDTRGPDYYFAWARNLLPELNSFWSSPFMDDYSYKNGAKEIKIS